jgi:hypothetical protein
MLFLRAEGFSCSFDVLCAGLAISKIFLFQLYFFRHVVIKTLDPDPNPDTLEMLEPDPHHFFLSVGTSTSVFIDKKSFRSH